MLEKLNYEYRESRGWFRTLNITVKAGVLYYEYTEMWKPEIIKGTLNEYSAFENALEDLKIYSFKNQYSYDDEHFVIMDGYYYSIDYKEAEKKRTKKIKGDNYFGDEIYSLFEVIETYIPQITLAGEVDEKEAIKDFREYVKDSFPDEVKAFVDGLKKELSEAKTQTAKARAINNAYGKVDNKTIGVSEKE